MKVENKYSMPGLVHIKTPSEVTSGFGTEIRSESGDLFRGVTSATIIIKPYCVIKAELEIFCSFEGIAVPVYFASHPESGERKAVKRIAFEDGTEWSADA